ncbi:3-carboxy-cis,cis-muconate cycloisomerase [Sulfitobacter noctilucicola]|uniref:3-carboxy-cis,cis-muconate cycloisomerase n=1 Tax=Sulfitobacter noctilucicola TaxID=1342301 RepID=A0A7W6M6Y0_9RHOB|nr:lyase family protein [Sulfitobacter noctilucicola]KIN61924.1 3-carboxy-cis,cis-muconate cycloisomerase [Sulfitobacter noctilucicola]MBB4173554.1 3-carboxy-cis,cis-muconate cycloisomerase [Sulfitobacter noctilucicola]
MAASVFDSPLYAQLFPTGEAGRLFSDTAAIRAMLLVEGALAKVQGNLGVIPEVSAAAIHRATMEIQVDPGAIAAATGENGVSVPGLVAAFRDEMKAPEHAQFVHWGATSQDIIDTGLMLRLRQALLLAEKDLRDIIAALGNEARAHAHLPMVARTYGQQATPTSWGAVLAQFGMPLIDALAALEPLRASTLWVSLSGAAGTSSALGPSSSETRAALADALGLIDPKRSWHTDRTPVLRIADWQGQVMAALGHMAQTLIGLTATETAEITLGASGASSTMPQKQNPVRPSAMLALVHQFTGLRSTLQTAAVHQHQRDGAAWFAEWMAVPQMTLALAASLQHARALAGGITPQPVQMHAALESNLGLIHAERLSFALADLMPRPDAQATSKALCLEARAKQTPLKSLAMSDYPALPEDTFDPASGMGQAPALALAFADAAEAL